MGEGYLTKGEYSPYYEVFSSEGGHTDFPARSEEDYELLVFAK